MDSAIDLLMKLVADRGAIVSSADCSDMEIAHAQADGRFWAIPGAGYGFVLRLKKWRELAEESISRCVQKDKEPGEAVQRWAAGETENEIGGIGV